MLSNFMGSHIFWAICASGAWFCGVRVWLYDIVAPFGGADEVIRDIRENVFPDRQVRTVQISEDGKDRVTVEWPAAGRTKAEDRSKANLGPET